ncbi:ATP-binding protein [Nonomuraea sp. NPDC049480]|uniref:ATP-binding protein n=1 Tax=Nonomuraea sp. NPDC049480 TaxID=3364353 RepID=UPI0037A47FDE
MGWRRTFAGRKDQASPARRLVRALLEDLPRVSDAEWVAGELISNALRHTRSGAEGGFFVVEVVRTTQRVRIAVYDLGGATVPDFQRAIKASGGRQPGQEEGGYGLVSVARLADQVGVCGDPIGGHAVWAELCLAAPHVDEQHLIAKQGASSQLVVGSRLGENDGLSSEEGSEERSRDVRSGPVRSWDQLPVVGQRSRSLSERGAARSACLVERVPPSNEAADQVSAFGQESWAQQELWRLRWDYPDWAFLVVRFRWMALQGKARVIVASGPGQLRLSLPSADERRVVPGEAPMVGPIAGAAPHGGHARGPVRTTPSAPVVDSQERAGFVPANQSETGTWAVTDEKTEGTGWWPLRWSWPRRRTRQPRARSRAVAPDTSSEGAMTMGR